MPVQQTFTLIPEARARAAATNNVPPRPMTSKQVKKAHKQANKQPKLSRAEQRRLELAEQERIRKELEKDRQAARARAARERKRQKEEAQKEAKRKSGKPLVDVRPSQDTISRFVRGNGTGKKRDGSGTEVAQKPAPLAAVSEEPEEHIKDNDETETETEKDETIDTADGEMGDPAEFRNPETFQTDPMLPAIRSSQRISQRSRRNYSERGSSQQRKKIRLSVQHGSSQSASPRLSAKPVSGVSQDQRPVNYDSVTTAEGPRVDSSPDHLQTSARGTTSDHPEESAGIEDAEAGLLLPEEFSDLDILDGLSQRSSLFDEKTIHGEQGLGCEKEPPHGSGQNGRPLEASDSFKMDTDDLVDDESLLQLDEAIEGEATPQTVRDKDLPRCSVKPSSVDPAAHVPTAAAKQDSQSSLDFDMLDNMNAIFEELTSCISPLRPEMTATKDDSTSRPPGLPDSEHPTSPKIQKRRDMRRVISFADEDLDDDTLLCLAEVETNVTDKVSCAITENTTTAATKLPCPRILHQPTSYERDLGLAPDSPPTRSFVPLSTQAILSDVDEFFPSPSQQARELDDMPASRPPSQLSDNVLSGGKGHSPSTDTDATISPQVRKRFFTASGSNELLSLALQRSRRSAALEEIRQKERQRHEAGLLEQAQHGTVRAPLAQSSRAPPQQIWQTKKPALASPWAKPSAPERSSAQPRAMPCKLSSTSPRVYIKAPPPPSNLKATFQAVKAATNASQSRNGVSDDDKENLAVPKSVLGHSGPPPASQESEYGGDWMDDAFSDFAV